MKFRRLELIVGLGCLLIGIFLIGFDVYRNIRSSVADTAETAADAQVVADQKTKDSLISQSQNFTIDTKSGAFVASKPSVFKRDLVVKKDGKFVKFLKSNGVDQKEGMDILKAIGSHYKSTEVKRGQRFYLTYSKVKNSPLLKLTKIIFLTPPGKKFSVIRNGETGKFSMEYPPFSLPNTLKFFKGTIQKSIYSDALRAGMSKSNMNKLAKLLSYSFDLERSIHRGDTFEVLIEKAYDDETGFVDTGSIVYINMNTAKEKHKIYRYSLKETELEYFNEKGQGIRKALLQTPIKGARVNSGFGSRMHPILGFSKMHKGIDFRARTGTPIMSAGDGFVKKIGYLGSYGNYILIQHSATYSTAYAHLSRYASNMRKGTHVKQGDVIGYVGATGRATGPHLHYEVLLKNNQINPKNIKMPSQKNLHGKNLENFTYYRRALDHKITGLRYS
ncbi:MAG: peptidoglycan DD-metalloendopeptidase family protein [Alphaproteobacteria bacterium]